MGKTVALGPEEALFCRQLFEAFYRTSAVPAPPELAEREYAFAPFEDGTPRPFSTFLRHRAIRDGSELHRTLVGIVPRHAYYSTSLYEKPDHPSMRDKGWLGADLVFDLDADHLREAETLTYPEQLRLARERFRYLLDEFLFGDFGLRETDVTLTFSGGRGYHAHVHADAFRHLSGGERREIVDYIMGTGFEPLKDAFFDALSPKGEGERASRRTFLRIQAPTAPGWKGRMSRGVHQWIETRKNLDEEALAVEVQKLLSSARRKGEAVPATPSPGKPSREARTIAKDLARPETQRAILDHQALEAFPHDKGGEKVRDFLEAMVKNLAIDLQGEMDAPVTTDVHRLIRMPGSLHGGTGFVVRSLTRTELERFDPFRSALPPLPQEGPRGGVQVVLAQDVAYPFAESPLRGRGGEALELARPEALFLMLRGEAALRRAEPDPKPSD